jgi:signal transduction histidine kinase
MEKYVGWQNNFYAWLLFATAIGTILMAALAVRRKSIPGAASLFWLMTGVSIWTLGYALELSMTDIRWQLVWAKIEYLGILSAPVLWLTLTISYTRKDAWLTRRNKFLLALEPVIALLIVWTNEAHSLVWSAWQQKITPVGTILDVSHGPIFYFIVAYAYLMLLAGAILLVITFSRMNTLYQRQSLIMLIGAAVPWLGNALYISGLNPFPNLDLTPFAFAITGVVVSWGLYRYHLLDIVPVARSLVVESMRDAVIVFDDRDRVIDLNFSAQQMMGSSKNIIGEPAEAAIPFWGQIADCLHDQAECGELILTNHGISGIFEIFKTAVYDPNHRMAGQLLLLREVTFQRRAEAELRAAKVEAEASSYAKSTFLSNMSHELRTPLTVMMGYADLLLEAAQDRNDTVATSQLEKIRSSGEHLLTLITDVLDYARIDSQTMTLEVEPFDVREMALETVVHVREAIEKNKNRLEVEISGAGILVADRLKTQQVLSNLLDNAAKFTQNGLVRLEISRQKAPSGERVVFHVIDSGIGIEAEQIKNLFKPFVQLDASATRKYGGTGLGLALSQRLCQLMGGEISVASQPGKGTVFSFWLPVQKTESGEFISGTEYG